MGASRGGVEALTRLCARLPVDFGAAVLVVLHIDAHPSQLPQIIVAGSLLPAAHATDGEAVVSGRIYVAPPDVHMLVRGTRIALERGPKEHHTRPAIDPLFRSVAAAAADGARVAAVVLTGELNDGTLGLHYVQRAGGLAIVQEPEEAVAPSMPLSACTHNRVDLRAPLDDISAFLAEWVKGQQLREPAPGGSTGMISAERHGLPSVDGRENDRTVFVCPSCLGSLVRVREGDYRCYVGHRFTLETLAHAQSEATDDSLWTAYRALCEKTLLLALLAEESRAAGSTERAENYERQRVQASHAAQAVRELTEHVTGSLVEGDSVR
jgi:two-component system chemotaxis response regulator CheB